MSEDNKQTLPPTDEREADLGLVNLGREAWENSGLAFPVSLNENKNGEELPKEGHGIGDEGLLNGEGQNADEWWKCVQILVKNEETESSSNDKGNNNISVG